MRKLVEFAAFLSIAAGAHALAFVVHTPEGDPQSAGAQGTELLSLTASSEAVAALVEQWETPPEVTVPQPTIAAPVAPPAPSMPELAMPETPQISTAGIALPRMTAPPSTPDLPQVQTTTPELAPQAEPEPAPEAEPAITASLRPMTRPVPPKPPAPKKAQAKPAPQQKNAEKTASVNSKASNAVRAAGQGGGQAAGQARTSEQAGLSPARKTSLMREWAAAIQSRIARNVPYGAGKGKATLRVTVGADGSLHSVTLLASSGKPKIDQVAMAAVKRAGKFPPAPKGISVSAQSFQLPVLSN